jgi:hypothetical protein
MPGGVSSSLEYLFALILAEEAIRKSLARENGRPALVVRDSLPYETAPTTQE